MNDVTKKDLRSLSYTSMIQWLTRFSQGKGSMLAKLDIKQAYRMVPVHPDDDLLLGMRKKCILIRPSHLA